MIAAAVKIRGAQRQFFVLAFYFLIDAQLREDRYTSILAMANCAEHGPSKPLPVRTYCLGTLRDALTMPGKGNLTEMSFGKMWCTRLA